MNNVFKLCFCTLLIGAGSMSAQPKLTDYVNPFRGTTTLWETEDLGYERHREARTARAPVPAIIRCSSSATA